MLRGSRTHGGDFPRVFSGLAALIAVVAVAGASPTAAWEFDIGGRSARRPQGLDTLGVPALPATGAFPSAPQPPDPWGTSDVPGIATGDPGADPTLPNAISTGAMPLPLPVAAPTDAEETWDTQNEKTATMHHAGPVSTTGVDLRRQRAIEAVAERLGLSPEIQKAIDRSVPIACAVVGASSVILSAVLVMRRWRRRKDLRPTSILRDFDACRRLFSPRSPTH